jgi:threonine aldolase
LALHPRKRNNRFLAVLTTDLKIDDFEKALQMPHNGVQIKKIIDLRSDTSSRPTPQMIESIRHAEVGNDEFGEDPTVNELQALAAKMLGKEAALLVPSGTQGNLVCILTQTRQGEYIIGEADSHIFHNEGNSYNRFAGLAPLPVKGIKGIMTPKEVERHVAGHPRRVGLITVENTHNRAGGIIVPVKNLYEIKEVADTHVNIPIHLDGSRIFNAAVALNVNPSELVKAADTVMFCLSKGLCAPIGSIVAGSTEFIKSARTWRKTLGGQMRQAGIIAAPGIVALTTMVDRLREDHEKARHFANSLNGFEGIAIDIETVQTNIVKLDLSSAKLSAASLVSGAAKYGIELWQEDENFVRAVFYNDISKDDVVYSIESIRRSVTDLLRRA